MFLRTVYLRCSGDPGIPWLQVADRKGRRRDEIGVDSAVEIKDGWSHNWNVCVLPMEYRTQKLDDRP
jgi:hypothetical protein